MLVPIFLGHLFHKRHRTLNDFIQIVPPRVKQAARSSYWCRAILLQRQS